jgi:uracil-DNA glycosylase
MRRLAVRIAPRIVAPMGWLPREAFIHGPPGITRYRGRLRRRSGLLVVPLVHPGTVARWPGLEAEFRRDLERIAALARALDAFPAPL